MLKKITLSLCFLLASASSLFALTPGSFVLYPQAGLGASGARTKVWSGDLYSDMSTYLYDGTIGHHLYKDAELKLGFSWSIGCGIDYAFTSSLALTSGLFIDKNSFEILYEAQYSPSYIAGDVKYKLDFVYLTIPVGLRFYKSIFMAGGGLYLGAPLSGKGTEKFGGHSEKMNLDASANIGLFIDAGLNFNTSDTNNLLIFLRLKNDLTNAYKEDGDIITNVRNTSFHLTAAYGFHLN